MVRATNIMGRGTTGVTQEGFATPVILAMKGGRNLFQFVHPDDLARFFADALDRPEWSGPVNLAAPDTIKMREIAEILGKRYVEVSPKRADAVLSFLWDRGWFSLDPGAVEAFLNFPLVDTTRLNEEFGFHCAWSSRDCVEDFGRTNRAHVFLGTRQTRFRGAGRGGGYLSHLPTATAAPQRLTVSLGNSTRRCIRTGRFSPRRIRRRPFRVR